MPAADGSSGPSSASSLICFDSSCCESYLALLSTGSETCWSGTSTGVQICSDHHMSECFRLQVGAWTTSLTSCTGARRRSRTGLHPRRTRSPRITAQLETLKTEMLATRARPRPCHRRRALPLLPPADPAASSVRPTGNRHARADAVRAQRAARDVLVCAEPSQPASPTLSGTASPPP